MAKYRVLIGIDYPPNRRAEVGEIVEDLPAKSIPWLLKDGHIEAADKAAQGAAEATPSPVSPTDANAPQTPAVADAGGTDEVSA